MPSRVLVCLVIGAAGGFTGSWVGVSTSASNDASAMTFGSTNGANATFSFVDEAGNDYRTISTATHGP